MVNINNKKEWVHREMPDVKEKMGKNIQLPPFGNFGLLV